MKQYECVIVGGGFAGLQAAIQLGRYNREVAVVDAAEGRSVLCRSYHNLIGWPDGVSGLELREAGKGQAERLGVTFIQAVVETAEQTDEGFMLHTSSGERIAAKRLLLATGVKDRIPDLPALIPCLGISVYVCPDCDGFEVTGKRTLVMGSGNPGAEMALALTYFTADLIYINHEQADINDENRRRLADKKIRYIAKRIDSVQVEETQLRGIVLEDGTAIPCERGFVAFGGNEVRSGLAKQLGVQLMDNRHVVVDPRTKMTSTPHVWAAGDVVGHSELVTIAMGDGSQAAIWIHKSLLET